MTDEAVLSAIACHTAGKPGMTRLDKILYLADMTSAEQDWPGVEKLRKLEKESGCRYAGRAEADQRFCALAGQAP